MARVEFYRVRSTTRSISRTTSRKSAVNGLSGEVRGRLGCRLCRIVENLVFWLYVPAVFAIVSALK